MKTDWFYAGQVVAMAAALVAVCALVHEALPPTWTAAFWRWVQA